MVLGPECGRDSRNVQEGPPQWTTPPEASYEYTPAQGGHQPEKPLFEAAVCDRLPGLYRPPPAQKICSPFARISFRASLKKVVRVGDFLADLFHILVPGLLDLVLELLLHPAGLRSHMVPIRVVENDVGDQDPGQSLGFLHRVPLPEQGCGIRRGLGDSTVSSSISTGYPVTISCRSSGNPGSSAGAPASLREPRSGPPVPASTTAGSSTSGAAKVGLEEFLLLLRLPERRFGERRSFSPGASASAVVSTTIGSATGSATLTKNTSLHTLQRAWTPPVGTFFGSTGKMVLQAGHSTIMASLRSA